MKTHKLYYKICYLIKNYYIDHKIIVYLPILIVLGFIIGVIVSISADSEITNFIDLTLNGEMSFGAAFMREFAIYIIVLIALLSILLNRYFHILAGSSLILYGYKTGYLITSIVRAGGFASFIHIIIICIPFFIFTSILLVLLYSFIMTNSSLYCISIRGKVNRLIFVLVIYSIIYIFLILLFQIIVPKVYILIFLK